jgi:hypothetical protein
MRAKERKNKMRKKCTLYEANRDGEQDKVGERSGVWDRRQGSKATPLSLRRKGKSTKI